MSSNKVLQTFLKDFCSGKYQFELLLWLCDWIAVLAGGVHRKMIYCGLEKQIWLSKLRRPEQ